MEKQLPFVEDSQYTSQYSLPLSPPEILFNAITESESVQSDTLPVTPLRPSLKPRSTSPRAQNASWLSPPPLMQPQNLQSSVAAVSCLALGTSQPDSPIYLSMPALERVEPFSNAVDKRDAIQPQTSNVNI